MQCKQPAPIELLTPSDKENATHIRHAPATPTRRRPRSPASTSTTSTRRRRPAPGAKSISSLAEPAPSSLASAVADPAVAISTPSARIIFPRRLARPAFKAVPESSLTAVDPALAGVAPRYVQDKLLPLGPALMKVLSGTITKPTTGLPVEVEVLVRDAVADLPTHMLAVHAKLPESQQRPPAPGAAPSKRPVTLFPVHDIVLAAHCANLPPLPPRLPRDPSDSTSQENRDSQSEDDAEPDVEMDSTSTSTTAESNGNGPSTPCPTTSSETVRLPVVPLCIPSPPTFPILQTYLYTKRSDHLLARLLPTLPASATESSSSAPIQTSDSTAESETQCPSSQSSQDSSAPPPTPTSSSNQQLPLPLPDAITKIKSSLAEKYNTTVLLHHALAVHGLWSNVCVLGVYDEKLWKILDLAWEILLGSLGPEAVPAPIAMAHKEHQMAKMHMGSEARGPVRIAEPDARDEEVKMDMD